jgi:hypothetical protein
MWDDEWSLTLRVPQRLKILEVFDVNAYGLGLTVTFVQGAGPSSAKLEHTPYRPDLVMALCEETP